MKNVLMLATAATMLGGCATTSFAPPSVNLTNVMETRGSNRSIGQSCKSFEKLADSKPVPIEESVDGARSLINNFILLYRCRAHSAANGRQIFEIPSFLTAVGTITATAFGAGPNVAIAGGSAASILNGSKNYYDPKGKADIFDSSLDALICIKMEAVGIDGFSIKKIQDEAEKNSLKFQTRKNPVGVEVGPETQYFDLVSSSLLSVERILAQRLSAVGVFDPAGVVAEIKQLSDDIEEANSPAAVADAQNKAQPLALSMAEKATAARTLLEINALKPKLQSCVVRAKL
tara:strand:+ start:2495 stop:3361 length:867 start_codon:yes stop_codon:yes gene_type:complete